ncbi:acyl-CoA dehydrogenase [Bradyrhizobium diazoefficiens]|uniref:Putative acyl-CoA dehydrogenase n=1 Tax=Bradyrhizobium diazoefficiens TaxID=1355477 RepID=A0A0E4BV15_9BRAD|nr:acyl-CoA dehydrogenase family protein [Bradyrhizobium diazoefficiens]MBR0862030.1 acyl-CoA dehydrogenase family protein [Bradyrhizobium diazoefficiens]MBR0886430.1 acyl-CoA dehydrogenase family protein [Bradyrhizobium diazoefficiens]MBR0918253.1 acyl-CoA dehydrogenase family protein [Bradyrhizobium diazoefficiens]BAR60676.1 putative acyl-CoA dehydrogenase [Bradyrhizobium diazoefficiens]
MSAVAKVIKRDWLDWPFFEPRHHTIGERLDRLVQSGALETIDHRDVDGACRKLVRAMGEAGLLDCAVAAPDGDATTIDSRSICLSRESLAYADGLADFAFAMQGLGSGAIALGGSAELRKAVLPKVRSGEWLAAFALSEKEAGSDVAAMSCAARADGDDYVIDGEKTWISNGGIADVYTLFARTGEAPGARGISAFVVFPDDPGFGIADRIDVIAPHPLATLRFANCRIPASRRLGAPGGGFKLAMQTLDIFRASVAAAALGFARRALDEALSHARSRRMFGATLGDLQLTQAALGDMATDTDTDTDAAALLTYRAAWRRDVQKLPTTREAAMAKLTATETAQRVIDRAVQMFGGRGVRKGEVVESLYREIRALRIYEGATEVQKLIVARDLLKSR